MRASSPICADGERGRKVAITTSIELLMRSKGKRNIMIAAKTDLATSEEAITSQRQNFPYQNLISASEATSLQMGLVAGEHHHPGHCCHNDNSDRNENSFCDHAELRNIL